MLELGEAAAGVEGSAGPERKAQVGAGAWRTAGWGGEWRRRPAGLGSSGARAERKAEVKARAGAPQPRLKGRLRPRLGKEGPRTCVPS